MLGLLAMAIVAGADGRYDERFVRVSMTISPEGRAATCTVVESDAPPELQAKTCDVLKAKAQFKQAAQADGKPYVATIRYRLPVDPVAGTTASTPATAAAIAQSTTKSAVPATVAIDSARPPKAPDLPPLAAGGRPFTSGKWTGACWKADPADELFTRCDGRYAEPGVAITMTRTWKGAEFALYASACPAPDTAPTVPMTRKTLDEDKSGQSALMMLAGAMAFARRKCPAFPSAIGADPAGFAAMLAGTHDLRKSRD